MMNEKPQNVLGLETATYFGGVALLTETDSFNAGPFESRSASRLLLASVHQLLEEAKLDLDELDLVAVSSGPGLFTGVRIGLSVAKTLTWFSETERSISLVAVPTLQAVAQLALRSVESAPEPGSLIAAITDARRGEVYASMFAVTTGVMPEPQTDHSLLALGENIVVRPENLPAALFEISNESVNGPLFIIGDGADRYRESWPKIFAREFTHLSKDKDSLPLEIARLGRELQRDGLTTDPLRLIPHYVRRPDARKPTAIF